MGLTDILTGMMNGPRGQRQPSSGGGGGGMSPIMMALLGLLAYKALKGRGGQAAYPGGTGQRMPPGGTASAGTAGGSVLSGGLGNIIKELQDNGHGRAAQSWVGTGPNEEIAPKDLANALGSDTLNALSKQTGLSVDDLLAGLSQHLPDLVDQLTPNGRLPSNEEAARMV